MHKIIKIVLIVLGVLSAILWYSLPASDMPPSQAIESLPMDLMFKIVFLLLLIATAASIFFGLKKTFTSEGGLKRVLKTLAFAGVLTLVGYLMAGGEETVVEAVQTERGLTTTVGTVKTIGTLLNIFFGMVLIAIVLMVIPSLKRLTGR
jgi:succinate dehydrogenase/fumarate reductase cytochrome b subunit